MAKARRSAQGGGKEPARKELTRLQRLIQEESLEEARKLAEQLASSYPRSVRVAQAQGQIAWRAEQFAEAAEQLQRAVDRGGSSAQLHTHLAEARHKLEDYAAVDHHLEAALEKQPDYIPARLLQAKVCRDRGEVDTAVAALDSVLDRDPHNVPALYQRISLKSADLGERILDDLERLMGEEQRKLEQRSLAGFALGKAYWDRGKEDAAFDAFDRANRMLYPHRRPSRPHPRQVRRAWRQVCGRDFFTARADFGLNDSGQVFIIGQSRTGKSLVESLLTCHPQVVDHGESRMLLRHLSEVAGETLQQRLRYARDLDAETSRRDAQNYLERQGLEAGRVHIGTLPENLWMLAIVGLWFPHTPIIFCKRGTLDQGLSSYFRYYERGNQHTFDLQALGAYIRDFEALIEFWRRRLPNPVEVIEYEDTVRDPQAVARRVYELVGLDFDPAYLERLEANAAYVEHLSPAHSLDFPTPVRDDFVGVGERFRDRLEPLIQAYQGGRRRAAPATPIHPTQDEEDERMFAEKIGKVTLRRGVVRIQLLSDGPGGQEQPSGELQIPASQYGELVRQMRKAGEQLQARQGEASASSEEKAASE